MWDDIYGRAVVLYSVRMCKTQQQAAYAAAHKYYHSNFSANTQYRECANPHTIFMMFCGSNYLEAKR